MRYFSYNHRKEKYLVKEKRKEKYLVDFVYDRAWTWTTPSIIEY